MSESADARYIASVLLLCFTAHIAALVVLFGSGPVAWVAPVVLGALTVAHGFDDRENPHPDAEVGE